MRETQLKQTHFDLTPDEKTAVKEIVASILKRRATGKAKIGFEDGKEVTVNLSDGGVSSFELLEKV